MAGLLSHARTGQFWAGLLTSLCLVSVVLHSGSWVLRHSRITDPSEIYFPRSRAAFPMEGERSAYHTMKILPPPAECRVQGFMIEALEPELNFRRPYTLGYSTNFLDKVQVLPFMRAVQDLSLRSRKRRVLVDVGPGRLGRSVKWFLNWYPLDFTEVHVFEADPRAVVRPATVGFTIPDLYEQLDATGNFSQWGMLRIPDWAIEKITVHRDFITAKNETLASDHMSPRSNLTKFLFEGLSLGPGDALILKMDMEGEEWEVLEEWLQIPGMSSVVDEIWVKMYYKDLTVASFGWDRWNHTREDSAWLLSHLRKKGFFVHYWP